MEGDHYNWLYATLDGISIHSLRMEGDNFCAAGADCFVISIHSLRMEGDLKAGDHRPR